MNDILLKNKGPTRFEATLYHDKVCRRAKKCFCRVTGTVMKRKGARPLKQEASFSLDVGETKRLSRFVLQIPQVQWAKKLGQLLVIEVKEAEPKPLPAAPKLPSKPKQPVEG